MLTARLRRQVGAAVVLAIYKDSLGTKREATMRCDPFLLVGLFCLLLFHTCEDPPYSRAARGCTAETALCAHRTPRGWGFVSVRRVWFSQVGGAAALPHAARVEPVGPSRPISYQGYRML